MADNAGYDSAELVSELRAIHTEGKQTWGISKYTCILAKLLEVVPHLLLCPATKKGRVLCYTLRTFECLSVRPSAVEHSCPVHNFDTV